MMTLFNAMLNLSDTQTSPRGPFTRTQVTHIYIWEKMNLSYWLTRRKCCVGIKITNFNHENFLASNIFVSISTKNSYWRRRRDIHYILISSFLKILMVQHEFHYCSQKKLKLWKIFFFGFFFFWQTIGETASLCSFKLFFWVVCNLHCARTVKITVHIFFSVKLFVGSVSLSYFVHWVKLLRCSELHHSTSYSRVLRAFSLKTLLLVLNLLSFSEH